MEDVIYFALDICYQVDVSHYWDLEGFLATVYYDDKHEIMISVKAPLVKKSRNVKDGQVFAFLDISNYL